MVGARPQGRSKFPSPGRVGLLGSSTGGGKGSGGESKGFGSGRVGVLFFVMCSRRGLLRAVWGSGKGWLGGARARGGSKGLGSGGVGGRGTGPGQGRSKFRNVCRIVVVSNAYKKEEKWRFLKDALWGGGGYAPELAWWTGG